MQTYLTLFLEELTSSSFMSHCILFSEELSILPYEQSFLPSHLEIPEGESRCYINVQKSEGLRGRKVDNRRCGATSVSS